uniref:Uncharacterized protein n=1 Tax=Romanomermis culicivorax TaxID=13658 RepID=A0A915KDV4_ROMCU
MDSGPTYSSDEVAEGMTKNFDDAGGREMDKHEAPCNIVKHAAMTLQTTRANVRQLSVMRR